MPRTSMSERVTVGQIWRRRRDGQLARVRQIHRADRLVELELTQPAPPSRSVLPVEFGELRTRWQPIKPSTDERSSR